LIDEGHLQQWLVRMRNNVMFMLLARSILIFIKETFILKINDAYYKLLHGPWATALQAFSAAAGRQQPVNSGSTNACPT
jgi:hypothetical protein